MNIKKVIARLTLPLLLVSGMTVAAESEEFYPSFTGGVSGFEEGLKARKSGDFKTALEWWIPLAEEGHDEAQYELGKMYRGGDGVSKNLATAFNFMIASAEQGNAEAQFWLGAHYHGGIDVPTNYKNAVKWHTKAVKQGHAAAQVSLGILYKDGHGVLTDYRRAYMWMNLGGFNGEPAANSYKEKLIKKMTPADISKAQEMSSRCLESNYTDCEDSLLDQFYSIFE